MDTLNYLIGEPYALLGVLLGVSALFYVLGWIARGVANEIGGRVTAPGDLYSRRATDVDAMGEDE